MRIKQGHIFIKWTQRALTHSYTVPRSVYDLETKGPEPDDYSKGWEVSEVRESLSESNRGGPVTILFVLRAWDWSLVFDATRASIGPQHFNLTQRLCATSSFDPI